ncbi:MAG: hypothetical protein AB4426_08505 [Xenococcaceae cyanobacterium]
MSLLLNKLYIPDKIEYLLLNQELIILETSSAVQRFADCPDEVMPGKDVRSGFPELIGVEDILMAVIQGQKENFELKGIARCSEPSSPLYIDLSIESLVGQLIILFEDVTEMMVLKQSLVQRASEAEMLLSALTVSQDYINKIILSMGDALLVTTTSGTIKKVNKAAEDLLRKPDI